MTKNALYIIILLALAAFTACGNQHVYLVYHATANGETGHTGIAVDNYEITVTERTVNGKTATVQDSVRTGSLTYYDFWTKDEYPVKKLVTRDVEPRYFKLPVASWEPEITLNYLINKGVPYHYGYPVEGLLQVTTTPARDKKTCAFLDSVIRANRPFNATIWNCSDFAELAIEFATGKKIEAKEFVWVGRCTTPNMLFKKASRLGGTKIIKDPGMLVYRIFLVERILKREILKVCGNTESKR
jgi:hypothetical protein